MSIIGRWRIKVYIGPERIASAKSALDAVLLHGHEEQVADYKAAGDGIVVETYEISHSDAERLAGILFPGASKTIDELE